MWRKKVVAIALQFFKCLNGLIYYDFIITGKSDKITIKLEELEMNYTSSHLELIGINKDLFPAPSRIAICWNLILDLTVALKVLIFWILPSRTSLKDQPY